MAPIVGLVLYGSRARGDHDDSSDVDLLALTSGGVPRTSTRNGVSVSYHSLDHVLRRARSGDLFVLHLVSEGKVVYEREPVFAKIQRAFRYRSDYAREIEMASDTGWFLMHHRDSAVDELRFNQRMAWCAHTLIVAAAATRRRPVFSAVALAAFAGSDAVASVIRSKRSPGVEPAALDQFRGVLETFGVSEPEPLGCLAAERRRFEADRNRAGLVAVNAILGHTDLDRIQTRQVAHDHHR